MKNTLKLIFTTFMILIVFDLMILFFSLAQVGFEGRTGYWSPFWRVQAEVVLNIIK